jgi:hypothetical protein
MEKINENKIAPTFSKSFGNGWDVMKKHFLMLFLVTIVIGVIVGPTQLVRINLNQSHIVWSCGHLNVFDAGSAIWIVFAIIIGLVALAYTLLIVPVFDFGANLMFVQAVRDIRPEFETLIKGFKEKYMAIILANLLTAALVMMGCIVLIVPGIIIGCRLAFVSYLVMDKNLDPIVAVEESWKLTKGKGWTIFAMGFVSIFIFILGLACFFVGVIPAIMWIKASFASIYQSVLDEKNASENDEK